MKDVYLGNKNNISIDFKGKRYSCLEVFDENSFEFNGVTIKIKCFAKYNNKRYRGGWSSADYLLTSPMLKALGFQTAEEVVEYYRELMTEGGKYSVLKIKGRYFVLPHELDEVYVAGEVKKRTQELENQKKEIDKKINAIREKIRDEVSSFESIVKNRVCGFEDWIKLQEV